LLPTFLPSGVAVVAVEDEEAAVDSQVAVVAAAVDIQATVGVVTPAETSHVLPAAFLTRESTVGPAIVRQLSIARRSVSGHRCHPVETGLAIFKCLPTVRPLEIGQLLPIDQLNFRAVVTDPHNSQG